MSFSSAKALRYGRMKQLSRKKILALPEGIAKRRILLLKIPQRGAPTLYFDGEWEVEINVIPPNDRYISLPHFEWQDYKVNEDCTETGDLVYEERLMQILTFDKN
jgi:hypothetical protein